MKGVQKIIIGLDLLIWALVLGSAVATESHRSLHSEQKAVLVNNGRLKNRDGKTYFVVRKSIKNHNFANLQN